MQKKARRERSKVKENAREKGKQPGLIIRRAKDLSGVRFPREARAILPRMILSFIPTALSGSSAWVSLDDSILLPQNTRTTSYHGRGQPWAYRGRARETR